MNSKIFELRRPKQVTETVDDTVESAANAKKKNVTKKLTARLKVVTSMFDCSSSDDEDTITKEDAIHDGTWKQHECFRCISMPIEVVVRKLGLTVFSSASNIINKKQVRLLPEYANNQDFAEWDK